MSRSSQHSRITKHTKDAQKHRALLLIIIPALAAQSSIFTSLPFLFHHSPPKHMRASSLSGGQYIHEVSNCGNSRRIREPCSYIHSSRPITSSTQQEKSPPLSIPIYQEIVQFKRKATPKPEDMKGDMELNDVEYPSDTEESLF